MDNIVIAVPKGRLFEDTVKLFSQAGILNIQIDENSRKLIVSDNDAKIDFLLVRAKDVITYTVEGISDLGVVGYDLLVEYDPDVFSLLDLKFGYCKVIVAGKEKKELVSPTVKVATKLPNITKSYFRAKEIEPKIVELYGSVELGPLTGLSEFVVDITSTGTTLKENNLVIIDEIFESTSRLISNRKSFYIKRKRISDIVSKLQKILSQNEVLSR
ncbi:MAG: ATP phosphoribosyltransferase [Brevinematales bacterium]|nr:ATP phosphoribosyltransferase [Brevinematales bacterium]